jgi:hypothetical protein
MRKQDDRPVASAKKIIAQTAPIYFEKHESRFPLRGHHMERVKKREILSPIAQSAAGF